MRLKRILLVDVERDDHALWAHPPLGLMYLAAAAREQSPELEVRIFHTVTCEDPKRRLRELVETFRPQLIGLRALSVARDQFSALCGIARQAAPDAVLIGGGPHASVAPDEVLERGEVDLVVIGEGEVTFTELLAALESSGVVPTDLPGTAVAVNGTVVRNPDREPIGNLDEVALPSYDLVDFDAYADVLHHGWQRAQGCGFIETSRGCPFKCCYCYAARHCSVRVRSPESVVAEMETLNSERGIRDFVVVDDIFNVPPPRAKSILRQLIRRLPGIRLSFPDGLRADQIDGELLDLLEEAGTQQLALAIETASPRLQRVIGKNLHLDKARDAIEAASKRFIVTGFFMVGLPGETFEEAMMTVGFAEELTHLAVPTLSVVRVYPGTPLWALLDPSPEQEALLRKQCSEGLLPRLMDDPVFYGDSFDRDQVPMTGSMVRRVRWEWARRVLYNPDRIRATDELLRRFIDAPELLLFYGQQFDRPDFSSQDLSRLLGGVRGGARATRRRDGTAPASA